MTEAIREIRETLQKMNLNKQYHTEHVYYPRERFPEASPDPAYSRSRSKSRPIGKSKSVKKVGSKYNHYDYDQEKEGTLMPIKKLPLPQKASNYHSDAFLTKKEERLKSLRALKQNQEMAEVKDRPTINKYDFQKYRPSFQERIIKNNGYRELSEKKKERELSRTKPDQKELKECTFKPNIAGSNRRRDLSRSISKNHSETRGKSPSELIAWRGEKENRLASLRISVSKDINQHEKNECTFKPELNKRSLKLAKSHNKISQYQSGGSHLYRDETSNLLDEDSMPIKKPKQSFVKEYLAKEKQDFYKPKINKKTSEIIENGYKIPKTKDRPLRPELTRKYGPEGWKYTKSGYVFRGNYSLSPDRPSVYTGPRDEEGIKRRFRKEAQPRPRVLSISQRDLRAGFSPSSGRAKSNKSISPARSGLKGRVEFRDW